MVQATNIARGVITKTREDYPGLVLPIEIKLLVDFVNSTLEGVPLIVSRPQHPGALEYMELVDIIMKLSEDSHGEK